MARIRIAKEDMSAFADASGDLNPLHLEQAPAAGGAFGAPVVYGVLAVLSALGESIADSDRGLRVLDATFARPLLVEAEYEIGVGRDGPGRATACIRDGDLVAARVQARFAGEGLGRVAPEVSVAGRLGTPAEHGAGELKPGRVTAGTYGGSTASLRWIRERFRLGPAAVGDYALHSLLYASYLVGMVMPGLGGMMSSLRLSLSPDASHRQAAEDGGPLLYRASVVGLEPQLEMVTLASDIQHAGRTVARLSCEARLPRPPTALDLGLLERELGGVGRDLEGRTAVVIGASRGLGAALAHGLAARGCSVYACSRSGEEGEPAVAASWNGAVRQVRVNGSDSDSCQQLLERIEERHGGLDLLLCCAAPPLSGIGFGPASASRFNAYIRQGVELVSVPMATMLGPIAAREGACLLVSSEAVTTMPAEWGHYVAAKGAGEALAAWAAKRFAGVEMIVARVPQLRGRPFAASGAEGGVRKEVAAAWLVRRLIARSSPGAHLLEWFGRGCD